MRVLYAYYFGAAPATSRRRRLRSRPTFLGLKIRAILFPIYMTTVEAMGAVPRWLTGRRCSRRAGHRQGQRPGELGSSCRSRPLPLCTRMHLDALASTMNAQFGAFAVSTKVIGSSMRRAARAAGAAAAEVPARHRDAQLWRWPRWRLKKPKSDLATGTAEAWSNARNAAQRGLVGAKLGELRAVLVRGGA
ncbi:MAG: hypothetical protein U1F25_18800 [Rubrivivax sp.]